MLLQTVRLFLKEARWNWSQLNKRLAMRDVGLICSAKSILNFPNPKRVTVGNGCTIGAFTVLDISDDPSTENQNARLHLEDHVYIGEHCNIRASGSEVKIGSGTMVANSVVIVSANHLMEKETPFYLQGWDAARSGVTIGKNCWLGSHCTILPGSEIGEGVVIAAGAVVRGAIPANTIWGGVPAKFIKNRQ